MSGRECRVLSNITVTNITSKSSLGGVAFIGVECGRILSTRHFATIGRIGVENSSAIEISGNIITGYPTSNLSSENFGIAAKDVTDLRIWLNEISNISDLAEGFSSTALFLSNGTSLDISLNQIAGPVQGTAILVSESRDLKIYKNTITGQVSGLGISQTDCNNSEITLNTISISSSSGGIFLPTNAVQIVRGNIISGPPLGIISEGEWNEISDNVIHNASMAGIRVSDGAGIIRNNTVTAGSEGIMLTMDDFSVLNNTISNCSHIGLFILGSNLTLSGNSMTNNTCNFYIDGNRIEHFLHHIDRSNLINGRPLAYIRDSAGESIGKSDDPAMVIAARSSNLTIQSITTGANMAGILLVKVTNATVSGLNDTASQAGLGAFWSEGCLISGSSATGNNGCGFLLISSGNITLDHCRVSAASLTGYLVRDSENILINSSLVNDETQQILPGSGSGMLIEQGRGVSILNTSIGKNAYSGINAVNTDGLVISGSRISHNRELGITCSECSGFYLGNSTITDNQDSGVGLDFTSSFRLNRNVVSGSGRYGLMLLDVTNGTITDNLLNNTGNVKFVYAPSPLRWNTTLKQGANIAGGPCLGGNFWANPNGSGFSQSHADRGDGICNASYLLDADNTDYLPLAIPSRIIPDFSADPLSGTPPLMIRFTDRTSGSPVSWNWTFGDGTTSREQHPVHTYTGIGRYSVTLQVTGKNGQQEQLRKPAYIDLNKGRISGPNGFFWLSSSPQNGSVYLDGRFIGLTPIRASGISAGNHRITLSHEGYRDWAGTAMVTAGNLTYLPTVKLQRG